jgi:hypothetical protein
MSKSNKLALTTVCFRMFEEVFSGFDASRELDSRSGSRRNLMKSLSELADIYDRWATANEATAEEILARLDSLPDDVRKQQRWRADQLVADAAALKIRAKELRDLDCGMVDIAPDGYKVPQDQNPACDGRQAARHYRRFR